MHLLITTHKPQKWGVFNFGAEKKSFIFGETRVKRFINYFLKIIYESLSFFVWKNSKQIEQYFSVLGSVGMGTRTLSGWIVLGQLNKAFQLCNIWWNFKVEHTEGSAEE